jgi:competence protein ComFC
LKPNIVVRKIANIQVISFFDYLEIEDLLFSKKNIYGSSIYNILAKNSFKLFAKEFYLNEFVYSIPIDDNIRKKDFSQTAILNKHLKSKSIKPLYNKLIAKNNISYAKQSLEFRLNNPRNFEYKGETDIEVILCDDVVTTGTTIQEAISILKRYNVKVLFVLVLADAKN